MGASSGGTTLAAGLQRDTDARATRRSTSGSWALPQAEAIDAVLRTSNERVSEVIELAVPDSVLEARSVGGTAKYLAREHTRTERRVGRRRCATLRPCGGRAAGAALARPHTRQ